MSERKGIDNFGRHIWQMFGAAMGLLQTALFGWQVALAWLIAWGIGGWVIYALATGRLKWHSRKTPEQAAK